LHIVGVKEETSMIARLLLDLLADVVFESAASTRRWFEDDMKRYLSSRRFARTRKPNLDR
jgi:hypothetical protein